MFLILKESGYLKETEFLNVRIFKDCGTFEIWNFYIAMQILMFNFREEQERKDHDLTVMYFCITLTRDQL